MNDLMREVVRDRQTDTRLRDMDLGDMRDEVHAFEDRIEALEAEVERLRHVVEVSGGNIHDLWTALRMVRDALEEVGPVGVLPSAEYEGVEPGVVAGHLADAIARTAARIPDPDDLRLVLGYAEIGMNEAGAGDPAIVALQDVRATLPTKGEDDGE